MGEAQSLQEGSSQSGGTSDEGVLLSKLIQLLNDRQCLLLSDLGALLPGHLRQRVKEQGGLRSWLQKYPSLFAVAGQPGQESVTLILGAPAAAEVQAVASPQRGPLPMSGTLTSGEPDGDGEVMLQGGEISNSQPGDGSGGSAGQGFPSDGAQENEDPLDKSAVQLRGLPFRATPEEVQVFLGDFANELPGLAPGGGIQLMTNRDGRPSGFARVQFNSPEVAKRCREKLHLKAMEERYVEVFLYNERPSKGRNRRAVVEDGGVEGLAPQAPDLTGVTRETVVAECREQMADARKPGLLMSMLGVALSQGARNYLKHHDMGLKNFLGQFPEEFNVEGGKGCEFVTYTPQTFNLEQALDGVDKDSAIGAIGLSAVLSTSHTGSSSRANSGPPRTRRNLETPIASPNPRHTDGLQSAARGQATPSDWGTPAPGPWGPTPENYRGCPGLGGPPAWGPAWGTSGFGGPAFMPPGDVGSWSTPWGSNPLSSGMWPPGFDMEGWPGAAGLWPLGPEESDGGNPGAFQLSSSTGCPAAGLPPAIGKGAEGTAAEDGERNLKAAFIRLRGLPFSANEQDILSFFAANEVVDRISDQPKAVAIQWRANGKSSGQAIVTMRSCEDAEIAQTALHGKYMGTRYIEVFFPADPEMLGSGKNGSQLAAYGGYTSNWNSWSAGGRPLRVDNGVDASTGTAAEPGESQPCWEVMFEHIEQDPSQQATFGLPPYATHFPWPPYGPPGGLSNSLASGFLDSGVPPSTATHSNLANVKVAPKPAATV
mmetsp:Transcript_16586/g.38321  ORF Transcript_16586/g.38321 Transcript_16586/m.38321 type:complete len:768 (-) Transcript_16586:80-2383(-)